jgi:hypothetical protein
MFMVAFTWKSSISLGKDEKKEKGHKQLDVINFFFKYINLWKNTCSCHLPSPSDCTHTIITIPRIKKRLHSIENEKKAAKARDYYNCTTFVIYCVMHKEKELQNMNINASEIYRKQK